MGSSLSNMSLDNDSTFAKMNCTPSQNLSEELKINQWLLNCEKNQRTLLPIPTDFQAVKLALTGHWVVDEIKGTQEYLASQKHQKETNDLEDIAFEVGEFVISFPTDNTVHYYHLLDGEKYNEKVVELSKPAGNQITYLHDVSMITQYYSDQHYQRITFSPSFPTLEIHNRCFDGSCDRSYFKKDLFQNLKKEVMEQREELEKLENQYLTLKNKKPGDLFGNWEEIYKDSPEIIDINEEQILTYHLDTEQKALWFSDNENKKLIHHAPNRRVEHWLEGDVLIRKCFDPDVSHQMFVRPGAPKPFLDKFRGKWVLLQEHQIRLELELEYQKLKIKEPEHDDFTCYEFGTTPTSETVTFTREKPEEMVVQYRIINGVCDYERTFKLSQEGHLVVKESTRKALRIFKRSLGENNLTVDTEKPSLTMTKSIGETLSKILCVGGAAEEAKLDN